MEERDGHLLVFFRDGTVKIVIVTGENESFALLSPAEASLLAQTLASAAAHAEAEEEAAEMFGSSRRTAG